MQAVQGWSYRTRTGEHVGLQYTGQCPIFPGVPGGYPYQVTSGNVQVHQGS